MYDALRWHAEDKLNFFRLYHGALMDGIVIDWWKVFGSDGDASHWKKLFPAEDHKNIRTAIFSALADSGEKCTLDSIWKEIRNFRNTYVAHLDFDEGNRAAKFPMLSPLRISGEVVYGKLFEVLDKAGRARGFPVPNQIKGDARVGDLDHYKKIVLTARKCLEGWENEPKG